MYENIHNSINSFPVIALFKNPAKPTILFPVNSSTPSATTKLKATGKATPITILVAGLFPKSPEITKISIIPNPINNPASPADIKYLDLLCCSNSILPFAAFETLDTVSSCINILLLNYFFHLI